VLFIIGMARFSGAARGNAGKKKQQNGNGQKYLFHFFLLFIGVDSWVLM
jgi:hypothetical protein